MKRAKTIFFLFSLFGQTVFAQIDDRFDYESLGNNPFWQGDTQHFVIANNRLRSNLEQTNSTFYISRIATHHDTTEWLIKMQLQFNTSSANYVNWVLMADSTDLVNAKNAYYVRIGNTADEVSLYKKKDGQTAQILINGTDGILNRSNNPLVVRVLRTALGEWSLWVNTQGLLEPLTKEGDTTDTEFANLPYTGILIRQSTASFFQKHFFDLFYMGKEIRDSVAPQLVSSQWIDGDSVHLAFSEELDSLSAVDFDNYVFSPSVSVQSVLLSENKQEIGIKLASPLVSLTAYSLKLSGIKDLEGNTASDTTLTFRYIKPEPALPYDVVINEIMATPTPAIGLPAFRYVELYNRSEKVIDLKGFKLSDRTTTSTLGSFLLLPDSFLLICPNAGVNDLSVYGTVLGATSFPGFNKTSDDVYLHNAEGNLIHSVFYTDAWYRDNFKKNGGFSLEMIDLQTPCNGAENWSASQDPSGGTPARHNSVKADNPDLAAPVLLNAYPLAPDLTELRFSEPLDSFSGLDITNYFLEELNLNPVQVVRNSLGKLHLLWSEELEINRVYTLTVKGITDCVGNEMKETSVKIGLPDKLEREDLLINEVLFNPPAGLTEFVEVYNNSNKILDIKDLRIGNLFEDGSFRDFINPVPDGLLIFPGQFLAFSTSGKALCAHYICENPQNIINVSSLPSYPQRSGGVVLTDFAGNVTDSFLYNENMHFKLLTDKKGVSLERIEFSRPATDPGNWASAAGNAGFATPAYANSQSRKPVVVNHRVWLDPEVFSPDGDGYNDLLNIRFDLEQNGFVANVYVYSSSGVFITQPVKNQTLSSSGTLVWDGFYENSNQRCPFGIYVVLFEAFHEDGTVVRKKFSCTLVGKN